jgi:hypothetical protein
MTGIIPAFWTGMKTAVSGTEMKGTGTNAPISAAHNGGQAA